jgi:hypothetical protein
MKKILLPILALILTACATPAPIQVTVTSEVTVTWQPTSTSAPTLTSTPTLVPTETATPKLTPPIETVPFNEKTYKNLPQLDVEAWEAAAGCSLTPKYIIEASKLGDPIPFPSDALVTGFYPFIGKYEATEMQPIVDKKVKANQLPMTFEGLVLTKADSMMNDAIRKISEKYDLPTDKWLALVWRVNTPSGELTGVMITDGHKLGATGGRMIDNTIDFLRGTGDMKDGKDNWTITPMTEMPTKKTDNNGDLVGSIQAEKKWEENMVIQQKIQEVMAGADLTKKEDLAELQTLFDENWLFMGGVKDERIQVK